MHMYILYIYIYNTNVCLGSLAPWHLARLDACIYEYIYIYIYMYYVYINIWQFLVCFLYTQSNLQGPGPAIFGVLQGPPSLT